MHKRADHGPPRRRRGAAPAPVVIAHVSDLHIGGHDPATAESLVADLAAVAPDLTVVTGDLTMRARPAEFTEVSVLLGRLPTPRLVILGNHDVPLAPAARFRTPYLRYASGVQADLDPVVELPGIRALGLNSMPRWRWKAGRTSQRHLALVTGWLGADPDPGIRLLALHHPPSARGAERIVGRRALLRALADARADLVLAGHTHVPAVRRLPLRSTAGTLHHVLEVTAGTATSRRLRGTPPSWTLLRVGPATIHVQERHRTASGWRDGPALSLPREGAVPLEA